MKLLPTPAWPMISARHGDNKRLPRTLTGIDRPRAVPLGESASLLEHQKAPCQLDHAAANSGIAGPGKSFLPPLRAALVRCSRQTGVTCHRPSISQIARENLTYKHIRRLDPDANDPGEKTHHRMRFFFWRLLQPFQTSRLDVLDLVFNKTQPGQVTAHLGQGICGHRCALGSA